MVLKGLIKVWYLTFINVFCEDVGVGVKDWLYLINFGVWIGGIIFGMFNFELILVDYFRLRLVKGV